MSTCWAAGCEEPAAYTTRTRPTWCIDHLRQIYLEGGLILLDEFTKPKAYLLTRCTTCQFEAHYRFEYVLQLRSSREPVCRACYWRSWAKEFRASVGHDVEIPDISEIRKKAEKSGFTYLGPLTDPSLEEDPHGTRSNVCGRIEAQREGDIGWRCPCQRNPKSARNGVRNTRNPILFKESRNPATMWWDHELNAESYWESVTLSSRRKVWWICPEGHSFSERIKEFVADEPWCPKCAEIANAKRDAKLASIAGKTVAEVPELLIAWVDEIPPDRVQAGEYGDYDHYAFMCASGHRTLSTPPDYFITGCTYCRGYEKRKERAKKAAENPYLSSLTPKITSQWHPTKNGKITISQVSPRSCRLVWWLDPLCGHEFQERVCDRDKYQRWRCPTCRTILDSWHTSIPS